MAVRTNTKMKTQVFSVCVALLVCTVQFVSSVDDTPPVAGGISGHTAGSGSETAPMKDNQNPAGNVDTGDSSVSHHKPPVTVGDNNSTNCEGNATCGKGSTGYLEKLSDLYEKGTIKRAFYVLIGITGIVVIYFIVRTVKSRRRRSKSKKYGVISMPGNDDLEMAPLDADDDEDDVTVFEVNGHK